MPPENATDPSPSRRRGAVSLVGAIVAAMILIAALPATAGARDHNKDRIPDRWERQHGLSLKVNQARRDQDRDALRNRAEFQSRMDPHDPDSDDDGVDDGEEGAGVIGSFDESTSKLRIDLFNGDTVTGLVTNETEIICDNGDDHGDEDGDEGSEGEGEGDFDVGEGVEDYLENSGDRRNSDLSTTSASARPMRSPRHGRPGS